MKFVYIPGGAVLAGVVEIVLEDNTTLRSVTRTTFSTLVSTTSAVAAGSASAIGTAYTGPFAVAVGVTTGVVTGIIVEQASDAFFDTVLWPESTSGGK